MEIKVFCQNCNVEILRADTDTLKTPLIGSMFKVKLNMEWNMFSQHDMGNDLICPMCEWAFHEDGKLRVAVNGDYVVGKPEVIIPGILACSGKGEAVFEYELNKDHEDINIVPYGGLKKKEELEKEYPDPKPLFLEEAEDLVEQAVRRRNIQPEPILKESDPYLRDITEQVEGKKPEPKPEQPQLNDGVWNKTHNTDEDSELMAKAPPGTEATEPVTKRQPKRVVKKRRAKKAMRKVKK